MYFIIFPKTFLPSITPCSKTIRFFSNKIISADSLAISTAVSTEIPTSAWRKAAASFIPSPIKPTVCPLFWSNFIILDFWSGESFAKTLIFSMVSPNSSSVIFSISFPKRILLAFNPTSLQIFSVTESLSPVNIFTSTPFFLRAFIASFAESFGGSKNPIYPIRTILLSSFTLKLFSSGIWFFCATPITLMPSLFNFFTILRTLFLISSVSSTTLPLYSAKVQIEIISSTAPFVISCLLPSLSFNTTDILLLVKSKGISSTFK